MLNNQLDQEDYQKFCDPLGLDIGQGKDYVQAFNQMHNKINVLAGEESKMPWSFGVVAYGAEAANEVTRRKEKEIKEFVSFQIQKELQLGQTKIQQQVQMSLQGLPPEEAEAQYQKQVEELTQQEKELLNPEQIINKYRKFRLNEEKLFHKLLIHNRDRLRLKHQKNEGWIDALVAGIEAVEVTKLNGIETVELLNPLGLAFHKSPESEFIEDGDWWVYKQEMSIGDIIDNYGDLMAKDDLEDLEENLKASFAGVYGLDAKSYSEDGYSPSHWEHINRTNKVFGTSNILHSGKYGQSMANYARYLPVYKCYWKSQREVGFLTYTDEYGEEQMDIVDELFDVPNHANKVTEKDPINNIVKVFYTWQDENNTPYSLEWKWIPQLWSGIRIRFNIYVDINPVAWHQVDINNPWNFRGPIFGAPFGAKNAPITSIFDRGVPWQKLYLQTMSKFIKLMSLDRGKIHTLNMLWMDKEIGTPLSLRYMMDMGFIPINPASNTEITQLLGNTMKMAEVIDMSNSQQIAQYINILNFLEQQIGISMGVPPEREARTSAGSNVTDNQQDLIQSAHITQPVLALHNLIWENVLNALLKLTKERVKTDRNKSFRFILSDEEIATLQVDPENVDLYDLGVYCAQNEKAREVLRTTQQLAQALLQNDKVNLSTLITMLETEDLADLKSQVKDMEQELAQREQMMQQQQIESQEKMQQAELANREDIQEHQIQIQAMKDETAITVAEISANSKLQSAESEPEDNTPEYLKIEQKEREIQNKSKTEDKKISQKKEEVDKKLKVEREKIKSNEKLADKKLQVDKEKVRADKELAKKEIEQNKILVQTEASLMKQEHGLKVQEHKQKMQIDAKKGAAQIAKIKKPTPKPGTK